LAEEAAKEKVQQVVIGNDLIKPNETKVRDIEDSVLDGTAEKKRLEKILDKTRQAPEVLSDVMKLIIIFFM
jgi:hypothetical protein